jgi:hypothetical protein
LICVNAGEPDWLCYSMVTVLREAIMLTINGRPIAFEECRRHRRRRSERARGIIVTLSLIRWGVLLTAVYGAWLLI